MKPLAINRQMLVWLHLCPDEVPSSKRNKFNRLIRIVIFPAIFAILLIYVVSSVAFFRKNVSANLEQSLHSVFQFVGASSVLYILVIAFCLRHKISDVLQQLSMIYEESKFFRFPLIAFHLNQNK